MGSITSEELRIKRLEEYVKKLAARFANAEHKLNQTAEDSSRDAKPLPNATGIRHFQAQANAVIGACTGNTLGTGSAFVLQVIAGVRYQLDPEVSVDVTNSTGGSIPDLAWIELILDRGIYSVIVANCTGGETKAPPPPEG